MSNMNEPKRKRLAVKATAVKEIPQGKKIARRPEYDEAFKKIIDSAEKIFKVEVEGRTVKSMYAPFAMRVKSYNKKPDRKFNAQLRVRSKAIYVVKVDRKD
jgi:hypothetical protein